MPEAIARAKIKRHETDVHDPGIRRSGKRPRASDGAIFVDYGDPVQA
jgi:hypothetical protein